MREPNKDYWKGTEVTDYEGKQRLLVPRKDEILDTIVDLIPFDDGDQFHVVDIGAGQGALSERILIRFSQAHVTLLDSSPEMLSVAGKRLENHDPRFSILAGDFNSPEWHTSVDRPIDAIVSAISLHYLATERRFAFFRSVFNLLSTPGYFANGDAFDTRNRFIQQRCNDRMLEYTQKQLLDTEGRDVSVEKLRESRRTESAKAGINRLLLTEQTDLLSKAGFSHVEVVWRYLSMAVVVGYKNDQSTEGRAMDEQSAYMSDERRNL